MTPYIVRSGAAETIPTPSGNRVGTAEFEVATYYITISHTTSMPHRRTVTGPSPLGWASTFRYGNHAMTTNSTRRPAPGGLARWFARAPRHLYRVRLGFLLGSRFVLLEHTGRRTGKSHQTVLEVVGSGSSAIDVAAAWGSQSDWFRNVVANPKVLISNGIRRSVPATATVLDATTSEAIFDQYRTTHPRAARTLARVFALPFDDGAAMARAIPVVRFTIRS